MFLRGEYPEFWMIMMNKKQRRLLIFSSLNKFIVDMKIHVAYNCKGIYKRQ